MQQMQKDGLTSVTEVGPVLQGLFKKMDRSFETKRSNTIKFGF